MTASFEADRFFAAAERCLRPDPPPWAGVTGRPKGDHTIDLKREPTGAMPEPRLAAVLVPLVRAEDGEAHLLFTERASGLRHHSGQISFPGGKIDPGETALQAALREAEEEIGLDPSHVRPLGFLDGYLTGTGFFVLPLVGVVEGRPALTPNPAEVADVFEVPLDFVMNPGNHEVHTRQLRGVMRQYYAMPFGDRYIWGVTAGILHDFYEKLGPPCSG